jgi:UDP-glucose 4-epimerase
MKTKNILVVGGAGYIGSHTVKMLAASGYQPIVVDSLVSGYKEAVAKYPFYQIDMHDTQKIGEVLQKHEIEAVVHFAAFIEVGESQIDPQKYYENNVMGTLSLLKAMRQNQVDKIVFSSTAATYGEPVYTPIDEKHPTLPINTYGKTKLVVEGILADYARSYGLNYIALRYFNASGADFAADIGESHKPETHLVPIILQSVLGLRSFKVFGDDYKTKDGTCVRDYIHVLDLASAHIKALEKFAGNKQVAESINLGNQKGYSILEVIKMVEKVTGKKVAYELAARRPGDPAVLIASSEKAKAFLGWSPQYDLQDIMASAWKWHQRKPYGFNST